MKRAFAIVFVTIAALGAGVIAQAAPVTVNATVSAGSTLSVSSLNTPSFSLTLNGDDQTASYQAQMQVVDARGLAGGGGWNLTIGVTQFSDGSGHTLPSAAQTVTSVTSGSPTGSTCPVPPKTVTNTSPAVPASPSTSKFLNAAT